MPDTDTVPLAALETALVQEFRQLQKLEALTRAERQALTRAAADELESLSAQKASVEAELGELERAREAALDAWARASDWSGAQPVLSDMLGHLAPAVAGRLAHLRQGILALAGEIAELTRGNRALAASALERVAAVREFLLSLDQPAAGYQPWGAAPARVHATLTQEHWA